jgi:uncharacterized membrane protein YccC
MIAAHLHTSDVYYNRLAAELHCHPFPPGNSILASRRSTFEEVGFIGSIQAPRDITSRSVAESCVYAGQAVVASLAILAGYNWAGRQGGMWAAVSAVLVLQPGFRQSLAASVIRVIANLLGAGIAVVVGLAVASRPAAVGLSLVLIILVCEFAKLDAGVRSACASVLIVSVGAGDIYGRGLERATAVAIGCGMALALQVLLQPALEQFRRGVAGGRSGESAE